MFKIPCEMNWCMHLTSLEKISLFKFYSLRNQNLVLLTAKPKLKVAKFNRITEVHSSIFRGHLATIYESS